MKKLLSLLLALALLFSLTGCVLDVGYELDLPTEDNSAVAQTEASAEASAQEKTGQTEETEQLPSEETEPSDAPTEPETTEAILDPEGSYTTKEDVALYIYLYGELPQNFMTKNEARALGWEGGSLERFAPGMCIGGDRFGNYEGLLPEADGRTYTECDIDTLGAKSRGAKRIVFSNDGLIYYTDDHYESFQLLYGEE